MKVSMSAVWSSTLQILGTLARRDTQEVPLKRLQELYRVFAQSGSKPRKKCVSLPTLLRCALSCCSFPAKIWQNNLHDPIYAPPYPFCFPCIFFPHEFLFEIQQSEEKFPLIFLMLLMQEMPAHNNVAFSRNSFCRFGGLSGYTESFE